MHRLLAFLLALFCFLFCLLGSEISNQNQRNLEVVWFTSTPFIEEDGNGNISGIEPEMFELFKEYMKNMKGESIGLTFTKAENFINILDRVKANDDPNIVGASALSITADRKGYAQFTETYLPDITVLVSSEGTPIVNTIEEKLEMIRSLTAVTIRGTKYETLLRNLKADTGIDFEVVYITSDMNILDGVMSAPNRFGFIDLPIYLMLIQKGGEVTRQNFFNTQGDGYAFILPDSSIWKSDLDEFLTDPNSKAAIAKIISKYLGEELYEFIDNLYGGPELSTSILTKEKELQLALIKNANLKLEEGQAFQQTLIVGVIVILIFFVVIGYLFYNNQKTTRLLVGQKDRIEEQQKDIRVKNQQLMNRNAQLVALNEEKNNLVKILAHDIRSPLSQIMMVVDIVNQNMKDQFSEVEVKMLSQVSISAERINQMVTKILDVDGLEETRIKVLQERVDVSEIMRDVGQRYRPIAAKKNIELTVELCENHNIIRTDHLLLLLVLENLISNAVKFSEPNTMVSLSSKCEYDNVLFRISDEGPGFSEEDKKKVFNKFQKLSAKPTAGEVSTGLGLSIVKKYVQDLGGKVWLESEEGKGSTFFVKLTV
ncbi:ATP-binding protein [Ekhidna sp.]|uniref:ATP-binding protein n=1 Tax=Ekhidna sp. TaxID=2608089 RepID=UPI00351616B3